MSDYQKKHMVFALSGGSITVAGLFITEDEADKFCLEHPKSDKIHFFVVRVKMYGLRQVVTQ